MRARGGRVMVVLTAAAMFFLAGSQGLAAAGDDPIAAEAVAGFKHIVTRLDPVGKSNSADSATLAWEESEILLAYISYAESTGDRVFLTRAMEHIDRILANRDDRHKRKDMIRNKFLPAWSTSRYTGGKRYTWIVHVGLITYPIARWVYLVKSDPALAAEYGAKALLYENELGEILSAFDDDWRKGNKSDEGYYYCPAARIPQPLSYLAAIGRAHAAMYLCTGEKKYLNLAKAMARYFKNRLGKPAGGYVWTHDADKPPAEDIMHAAICVDFAVECHRAGIVFSQQDMTAFARTFKRMHRGEKGFALQVNGKGGVTMENAAAAGGWVRLGWFDPEVREIFYPYAKAKWRVRSEPFLPGAACLIETGRPFTRRKPIRKK